MRPSLKSLVPTLLWCALAALPMRTLAAAPAMLTIVEGEASLIREAQRLTVVEGLPLRADDIVRTGEATRLVRVELADGTAIDLGPGTQAMVLPRSFGPQSGRPADLYLMHGWAKLTAPKGAKEPVTGLAAPRVDVPRVHGTVLVLADKNAEYVFAESGAIDVTERRDGKAVKNHALKDGEAYARRPNEAGSVNARPDAELLKQMPRAFADTLPLRAARFAGMPIETPPGVDIGYDDVAPWINGEAVLRPGMLLRYGALARQPRFRTGLVADLKLHPEWDRVLFPEKYRPKPPVVARRNPATPATPVAPAKLPPPAGQGNAPGDADTQAAASTDFSMPLPASGTPR